MGTLTEYTKVVLATLLFALFVATKAIGADTIVIVYPEAFSQAATLYDDHRSTIDVNCYAPATVIHATLEHIDEEYGDDNGTTTASEIRAALLDMAVDGGADYVVLCGDKEAIPEPVVQVGIHSFYSDDWYVDSDDDYVGDIAIGRIPGETSAQIENYVEKVIEHDQSDWMSQSWRNMSTLLVGNKDNVQAAGRRIRGVQGDLIADVLTSELPWEFQTAGCGLVSRRSLTQVPYGSRHEDVVDQVEAGRGIVFAVGTAAATWSLVDFITEGLEGGPDSLNLSEWPTEGKYPIAFGFSCEMGDIYEDEEEDRYSSSNVFRRTVLAADRGFVGAIGPTNGVRLSTEEAVIRNMVRRIAMSPRCGDVSTLGDIVREMKIDLLAGSMGLDIPGMLSHRVLGDPAMRIPVHLDALKDATIVKANTPVRPGSYVNLHMEGLVDENYPTMNHARYSYTWSTTNGRFWDPVFNHWVFELTTSAPVIDLFIPNDGSWQSGDEVNVSLEVREKTFSCNGTATNAAFEVIPLPVGGGGCPIVQAKVSGVWTDVNSVLGDRVYSGTTLDIDDYLHLEPPTSFGASPVFEVKLRESTAENHTLIDFAEVSYVEWPTGAIVLTSQSGSAFECDSVVSADTSWAASGAHLQIFLGAEDTLHVTMERGDTLFAVFGDDSGSPRVGLAGVRGREKPLLVSFNVGGDDPWGLKPLNEFGLGAGAPILPRKNWSPCFADSPLVVRGDGIPDTVAWEIGEAHQLDEVFLLDGVEAWGDTATYQVQSAVHTLDGAVTTKFTADDGQYARIDYGEDTKLTFPYPSLQSGKQREIVLHLRGTYEFNGEERVEPEAVASLSWGFQTIYPNPTTGRTHIVFSGDNTTRRQLAVYDVGGRRIRNLYDGIGAAGLTRLEWDGLDDRSHSVSAGVYFIRLQEGDGRTSEKLVVLR